MNGVYASRRHCEIWLDHGVWWVTDTGIDQRHPRRARDERAGAQRLVRKAGIGICRRRDQRRRANRAFRLRRRRAEELSAARCSTSGATRRPRRRSHPRSARTTTPSTPIVAARPRESGWSIVARMASGARTVELDARESPVLGRTLARTGPRRRLGARGRVGASHRHHGDRRNGPHRRRARRQRRAARRNVVPAGCPDPLEVRRVDRAGPGHRSRAGVRAHVVAPRFRLTALPRDVADGTCHSARTFSGQGQERAARARDDHAAGGAPDTVGPPRIGGGQHARPAAAQSTRTRTAR